MKKIFATIVLVGLGITIGIFISLTYSSSASKNLLRVKESGWNPTDTSYKFKVFQLRGPYSDSQAEAEKNAFKMVLAKRRMSNYANLQFIVLDENDITTILSLFGTEQPKIPNPKRGIMLDFGLLANGTDTIIHPYLYPVYFNDQQGQQIVDMPMVAMHYTSDFGCPLNCTRIKMLDDKLSEKQRASNIK